MKDFYMGEDMPEEVWRRQEELRHREDAAIWADESERSFDNEDDLLEAYEEYAADQAERRIEDAMDKGEWGVWN